MAYLNRGIRIHTNDQREVNEDGSFLSESFFSEGGLREFVTFLDKTRQPLVPEP
ncbi:MAG: hypothetical protein IPO64_17505, partial [Bacteroidetes bacterium]|nr:hypothetical protein [Bacteroidota bacterium]